jgi:hypothetical protein
MYAEQLELPNIIDYSKDKWELKIEYDDCYDSPRDWDNLGTICVSNRCRYCNNEYEDTDSLSWSDERQDLKTLERKGFIVLPLSYYDHSAVSIYIGNKCDPWDSGRLGWYIVNKEKIRKEYGVKRISKKLRERVEQILDSEVKTFNHFINGEVYSFTLKHNDEEVDSCGGFYENDDVYDGFIEDMYSYFPKEFTDSFTVEQAKAMAIKPWQ